MSSDATNSIRTSERTTERTSTQDRNAEHTRNVPAEQRNARVPLLNTKDDIDVAMEWIVNGKIDGKHLAKKLPHTVQDVRDGTISSDAFLQSMGHALYKSELRVRVSDNFQGTHVDLLAYRLTAEVLPESYCNDQQKPWLVEHARPQFARDLLSHLEDSGATTILYSSRIASFVSIASLVLDALCATCDEWARQIDGMLFKGQHGAFRFFCRKFYESMHTMKGIDHQGGFDFDSVHQYGEERNVVLIRDILHEAHDDAYWKEIYRLQLRNNLLCQALWTVTEGHHEAFKTCWECQEMVPLMHCSKCKVAHYCGRGCQRKAFRGGHKKKCELLKAKHDGFLKDLDIIDQAYEAGGTTEGIKLNVEIDYEVSRLSLINPSPFPKLCVQGVIELENTSPFVAGPSIQFFYENISRVFRGEWWIYQNTVSLQQYRNDLIGAEDIVLSTVKWVAVDERYFNALCICLSYDIVGFTDELPEERRELMVNIHEISPFLKAMRDEIGLSMPVERFIELYKVHFRADDLADGIARRLRSNEKARTFQLFREMFHK